MAESGVETRPDALRFSVDSQLVGELGERLVTRNHVALAELVKNAYDADASSISIEFRETTDSETGEPVRAIVLSDDGHGMRFSDVDACWMRIATSNKVREPFSPRFGRPKTGNKGIGRFACQRLAAELVLTTVAETTTGYERTTVDFDWADFRAGTTLTGIPCQYRSETLAVAVPGTTLELVGLRDAWPQRDFNTLRRSISWLTLAREVRRRNFEPDPGFSIELRAGRFDEGEGLVLDQLVDSGWGRLQGTVLGDGRASLKLRGNYLEGEKHWTSDVRFHGLSGVSCDIGYFVSGEAYELVRNKRILTKTVLAQLREEAGVRVYYEAFRVFPMGERGDDWLGLDRDAAARKGSFSHAGLNRIASQLGLDSRTPLLRPRNENLLGRVEIGGTAGRTLQIKMNREGFVETDSLRELVDFVRLAIEWMTIYYAQARNRYERGKARAAERDFVQAVSDGRPARGADGSGTAVVMSALDFLADHAEKASRGDALDTDAGVVEKAEDVIHARFRELDSEIGVLRTLASTGPLLFTFAHEVNALIGSLGSNALRIDAMAEHLPIDEKTEALAIAKSMRETAKNFDEMSGLFGVVTSARQSKPKRHYVRERVKKIVAGTHFTTAEAGINVEIACSPELKSPRMFEAELVSIMVNLYSNAIKSCLAAHRSGASIKLAARQRRNTFVFEVRDQGVGLPEQHWDEVLEPFCSDPADLIYPSMEARIGSSTVTALARGSGLGLSIVNGICEDYGGAVQFGKPDGWSLAVRVTLPVTKVRSS